MNPDGITLHVDVVAEKLDDLADLFEYWKKNREKGRNPRAIRAAILMTMDEVVAVLRVSN